MPVCAKKGEGCTCVCVVLYVKLHNINHQHDNYFRRAPELVSAGQLSGVGQPQAPYLFVCK